jgi:hypothetical protein
MTQLTSKRKPCIGKRRHKDPFEHARYIPYLRARAQCNFRHEEFLLTFRDWCDFWSTEQLWLARGRAVTDLALTRIDPEKAWSRTNCCIINRLVHLNLKNKRLHGMPWQHLLEGAITLDKE